MTQRARRALLGGVVAAAGIAFACTQVSTDPNSVLSLELLPPVLPSLVVDSQLHAATGAVDSLHATAYNSAGEPIVGAPVRFLYLFRKDTIRKDTVPRVEVDSVTGHVTGLDTGSARVIAYVGGLQTLPQTLFVVLPPNGVIPVNNTHYVLNYNQDSLRRDTLLPIRVRVVHVAGTDTTGVPHYLVRYKVTYPATLTNANPDTVQLVNSAGAAPKVNPLVSAAQIFDTTSVPSATVPISQSTLSLRATLLALPYSDTVGIDVFVSTQNNTPLPGSPVHFVITLNIY